MTCRYCDFDGKCDMWDDAGGMIFEHIVLSCDDHGHCLVEEDVTRSGLCEDYEEA